MPGASIPLDGRVTQVGGAISVDEAAITGESKPQKKGVGDDVKSGTSNNANSTFFVMETTARQLMIGFTSDF